MISNTLTEKKYTFKSFKSANECLMSRHGFRLDRIKIRMRKKEYIFIKGRERLKVKRHKITDKLFCVVSLN